MPESRPPKWKKTVILKDGTSLLLRPITPKDTDIWIRFLNRVSPESIYRRFHGVIPKVDESYAHRFTHIDYDDEMAIVGVAADSKEPQGERMIAVGRLVRLPKPTVGEVAFLVEDASQGRGIGSHLLQELLPFARLMDIERLEAIVLAENREMIRLFQDTGFVITSSADAGTVRIELVFEETAKSRERRWAREQSAYIASIERLFRPRSVAVIGASNTEGTIGNALISNLLKEGFTGQLFPVNPKHSEICSLPAYGALADIPAEVDMAVVAVPAAQVSQVIRQCADKRVYSAVIISAGFSESGPEGRAMQDEVLTLARQQGMRLVGPNCLGLLNTEAEVRLNATFAPQFPPPGRVAISSQSGALGIALLNHAKSLRLGISQFVGVGNKADISGNDLLYFWGQDPNTAVILLYLESFGNPKKFGRISRRVSREKPIVVLKSGKSQAGQRAASSHTGAMASSSVVADALMAQAGIVQVESMEQFFNAAKVLSTQPRPQGRRLAILTNAGGPGILCADRAEAEELTVTPLSPGLQSRLRKHLPATASTGNPVDMIAAATPKQYENCLRILLSSKEVDQVIVMFIPPVVTEALDVARAILKAHGASKVAKPVVAVMMGEADAEQVVDELEAGGISSFRFPEETVVALAQYSRYADWLKQPQGQSRTFENVRHDEARQVIVAACGEEPGETEAAPEAVWLSPRDGYRLLESYGIKTVSTAFAATAADAAEVAKSLGYPVAMKLASTSILHKSDVKGVYLGLRSDWEVRGAFGELEERLTQARQRKSMDGVLIQPMASSGLEAVLGVSHDATFGPVMMAGLGGVYLELFQDVQFTLLPVTDREVERMLQRLKAHRIFSGYRGEAARDVAAFSETMLRLSQLVDEHPQIHELDLNPVMLMPEGQGCVVVDARVRVQPVDPFSEYVISQIDA